MVEEGEFEGGEPHPDDRGDPISVELRDRIRVAVIKIAESEGLICRCIYF